MGHHSLQTVQGSWLKKKYISHADKSNKEKKNKNSIKFFCVFHTLTLNEGENKQKSLTTCYQSISITSNLTFSVSGNPLENIIICG